MRARLARLVALAAVAVLLLFVLPVTLAACGGTSDSASPENSRLFVPGWTLRADGREVPITLPRHFDDQLPSKSSLGVMAFELLAGVHAFRTPAALARLEGTSSPPPASLAIHRPDLDLAIVELLDACLSFDPATRPTAEELARAIRTRMSSAGRSA